MPEAAAGTREITCPTCGTVRAASARFCPICSGSFAALLDHHAAVPLVDDRASVRAVSSPASAKDITPGLVAEPDTELQGDLDRMYRGNTRRERREARAAVAEVDPALARATANAAPGPALQLGIRSMASVDRGLRPEPGAQAPAYYWPDLPEGDAPPRRTQGEGSYVVYHAMEVDADVRIFYQTVVGVRKPRGVAEDAQLVVDARTSVSKRALLEVMDHVRQQADHHARRRREHLAAKLARHRWEVLGWPRRARAVGFALVRVEARVGGVLLNARRNALRALVEVPDAIASRALRVDAHLSTRIGRQSLWDGIQNPQGLSAEQRSVLLFLTLAGLGVLVLLLNSIFALGASGYADTWRDMLKLFAAQLAGLFGLPIPIEIPFLAALLASGRMTPGAVAISMIAVMAGKMLGAWILYLLGDGLLDHVRKHTKSDRAKRLVSWMTANADKHGFSILVLDNAVPFMPDQLMLVLAVTGMRFRAWMWGIGIGTFLKFGGIVAAVYSIGPDQVANFFEHPFG